MRCRGCRSDPTIPAIYRTYNAPSGACTFAYLSQRQHLRSDAFGQRRDAVHYAPQLSARESHGYGIRQSVFLRSSGIREQSRKVGNAMLEVKFQQQLLHEA